MQYLNRALRIPKTAWEYSQHHPLEAFIYATLTLLFSWGAKVLLSVVAIAMMAGSITKLLQAKRL